MDIKKICVIGSGVMGAGIAAQAANSFTEVILLDIPSNLEDRNKIVKDALLKMQHGSSKSLAHPQLLKFITPGNLEDDIELIEECDWVIEVVTENLQIKQQLYNKILPYLKNSAYLSSNTSTFPLKLLKENLPKDVQERFFITHFFNPPRYMRLNELVIDDLNKENKEDLITFIEHKLGKKTIICNDTPGFIANRVGCFLMEITLKCAIDHKVDIEEIDNIYEKLLGLPKTGIFGLMDLIGLDVMKMIAVALKEFLPPEDRFNDIYAPIPQIEEMLKEGFIGRKGKGGFYKVQEIDGRKIKEVLDLSEWRYKPALSKKANIQYSSLEELISSTSPLGLCFKKIMIEFGVYVCSLIPEATESPASIDDAMKLGYNWRYGPFEIINKLDKYGFEYLIDNAERFMINLPDFLLGKRFQNLQQDNSVKTLQPENIIFDKPGVAELKNFDNKVLCFTIKTKLNCLTESVFNYLLEALDYGEEWDMPIIIFNSGKNFCVGADLSYFLNAVLQDSPNNNVIQKFIQLGQRLMLRIKYSKVPVISCAQGFALGGGSEILLHSTAVVAHLDSVSGLVETGIGVFPAWGGFKETVMQAIKYDHNLTRQIKNILEHKKFDSAYYLRTDLLLDKVYINMNTDFLLQDAIIVAEKLAVNFQPKAKASKVKISNFAFGEEYINAIEDPYIKNICLKVESFLNSKDSFVEQELLDFECEYFCELVKTEYAQEKIRSIIK